MKATEEVQKALETAARYYARRKVARCKIASAKDVFDLMHGEMVAMEKENFVILLLDQKHKVIARETVSVGTATAALVHPREVYRPAILANACAIIAVHNHPSGDATPSGEDKALTARLVDAGRLIGIPLIDHVILGAEACYSFAESGAL